MNSPPPSSLASLLAYPSGGVPADGAASAQEGDAAALINYLGEHYDPSADEHSGGRPFLNNGDYLRHAVRERDEALPTSAPAPASPLDPSIAIPTALSDLAASATDVPYFAPLPPLPAAEELVLAPDRGEMGGKRRKAPHERAGWKEMEEDAQRGEKRLRTAAAAEGSAGGVEEFVGYEVAPAAAGESLAAAAEAADASAEAVAADGEDDKRKPRAKLSKELRAEQNRKAQQVFRRKREEKMKQLELDSLALAQTRERLAASEARINDVLFELEAKMIEAAGLRQALVTASVGTSSSFVRTDGSLAISTADWETRDPDAATQERTQAAVDDLARASRQLAKLHRARRLGEAQIEQTAHEAVEAAAAGAQQ
ncbi:uncharacterized protein LOC62_07G009070 [Vanrija pseudolonga]|uniref:BZIP domain-containing protein n=1 Tax=Vanrija pseudolonga TaxID=143232 RepID=A0AAF0YFS2_9TREE|nr:hypothetical protein LOC62_07G009070 [Vanrija pseudolonga]